MTTGGDSIKSKTGNAQIKRMGQTTSRTFGSDPNRKQKFGSTVTDLRAK